jgi:nucleoside-triphosphatase THEP1
MSRKTEINEKWIKASIIGTIWAASEIVLGSFLHNLRIPFSSNMLTAIGIIILISTSFKWTEKGLFWRAGLICALMKTMSPSAVIFGPMIAIFSQAMLLEIFTRLIGRNILGFAVGAMFAMTWNLFQKIVNFILFYGFNIVSVYSGLLKWAQKQLSMNVDLVWSPILVLALVYCSFGLVAATVGIRVGRKLSQTPAVNKLNPRRPVKPSFAGTRKSFNYSIPWLIIDICFIVGAFFLLNFTSWLVWSLAITTIVTVWVLRYKRALRQLSKPRFWIFFVVITMVTAFVFNKMQEQEFLNGLMVGIKMNFRAVIVILGFSVIGTELYNPKIREFFRKTSFKQLPLALELSFESLPFMIATIPEFKEIVRNPVSVIFTVLSQIEHRLNELKTRTSTKTIIISGSIGEGKTTQIRKIAETLQALNIPVRGIYSPRIMQDGLTTGYDIIDAETNMIQAFLRIREGEDLDKIGKYSILPEGLAFGMDTLKKVTGGPGIVVVVDEVGRLEMENQGWSPYLKGLIHNGGILILGVRDTLTNPVIAKWELKECSVFPVADNPSDRVSEMIYRQMF